jgi:hypothetical protein
MAPRSPTLAVLVVTLLAACATTRTTETQSPTDPTYLRGRTSEYSVRLDELRARDSDQPNRLPYALVGGDETMTIAASMFRKDHYLALDMVVQNQTGEPLTLHRDNIQLFDGMGNRLSAVDDWEGADQYGLRAKAVARRDYASHSKDGDATPASIPRNSSSSPGDYLKKSPSTVQPIDDEAGTAPGVDFNLMGDVREDERSPTPLTLLVPGNQSRPYWAYWHTTEKLSFPLMAMVTVNHKRVLLKYEDR